VTEVWNVPVETVELHPWNVTPSQAREIQEALRERVVRQDHFGPVRTVGGVDVGFTEGGRVARAAVAVLTFPGLEPLDRAVASRATEFPYIPGLLSFREIPVALEALRRLGRPPDLILCDGQGVAHPRRFGLACHLGLVTGIPCIGAAKSRLVGSHRPLSEAKGSRVALIDGEETVGAVVRTRTGVAPLFVSIGHRVSLDSAVGFVLACCRRYRLPETTREAHRLASRP
jgi:deoxyribonuclease V